MYMEVGIRVKGVDIKAQIRCDFGNCVRFQFYDTSHQLLASGYKNINLGLDEYPEKRIKERGLEEVVEAAKWLFNDTVEVVSAKRPVISEEALKRSEKWRKLFKSLDRSGESLENKPVQLTIF